MQVEQVTTEAELQALRPEWNELLNRCPEAPPFLAPEWLLAWWRHLGGGRLLFTTVRAAGRLVALLPAFVYAERGRRRLALLGSGLSDELDLLADPACSRHAAADALSGLAARRGEWDDGSFSDLPPSSVLLDDHALDGLGARPEPSATCHVLDLPASVEAFQASLTPHQRRNLRRASRLLGQRGALRFSRVTTAAEARDALEELFVLHAARWCARGEAGVLATRALRDFHREAAAGLLATGALRLRTLHVGGMVAAVLYGFARGRRAYAYLAGFDPALAQGSPGTLLTAWAIEDSIAEGLTSYDFLRGDEPHKLGWGTRQVGRLRLVLTPCASC